MLRAKKESEQKLIFKSSSIISPIISIVVGIIVGWPIVRSGLEEGELVITALGALVLVGIPLVGLLTIHITTFAFDKSTGELRYDRKKIIGSDKGTYAIADISRIRVEREVRYNSRNSGSRSSILYNYFLEFHNGADLKLGRSRMGGSIISTTRGSVPKAVLELQNFLGIKLERMNSGGAFGAIMDAVRGRQPNHTQTVNPHHNPGNFPKQDIPQKNNMQQNQGGGSEEWKNKWK